jgi:hypothetical protein
MLQSFFAVAVASLPVPLGISSAMFAKISLSPK